jgi:hypothetical protein
MLAIKVVSSFHVILFLGMVGFGGPLADLIWGRSQDWILHKD